MAKENLEEHFVGRVAQKAILIRGGAVLAVLNHNGKKWSLPGGRLHKGELPLDGLKREVREEIGAEIDVKDIVCVELFSNPEAPHVSIGYTATFSEPEPVLTLAKDEIAEITWVPLSEVDSFPFYDDCRNMIRAAKERL